MKSENILAISDGGPNNLMSDRKKRDSMLDVAKGLGIILVVIGHIHKGVFTDFIYLFHMPFFFFLSGAAISYAKKGVNIVKSIRTIVFPYFFFSIISFLYWILIEQRFRPPVNNSIFSDSILGSFSPTVEQFFNIFIAASVPHAFVYNIALWFLPCLFCSKIVFQYLRRFGFEMATIVCIGIPIALCVLFDKFLVLPWCFELSLIALPLIWGGCFLYGKIKDLDVRVSLTVSVLFLSILGFLYNSVGEIPYISMLHHNIGNIGTFYLIAFVLIFVCLELCKWMDLKLLKMSSAFIWLGQNSLIIMCVHGPIERIAIWISSMLIGVGVSEIRYSLLYSIVITIFTIIVSIPIIYLINNFFPYIIGKKIKKQ